jgi:toxin ParE1/3/4
MKSVLFHAEAEAEFRAAISYYEGQREGLGTEFRDEVERSVERIARLPQLAPPHGEAGLRKLVVRRFPYKLFYLELEETIWIAAVAHQKRKPGYWAHRSPD